IVRLKDAQAIADRQAWRDDEEAAGVLAAWPADRVQRLPGDEHRHHGGLAGAGGQLQREALDVRIRLGIDRLEILNQPLAGCQVRRHLGEPDRCFHRFDLAEERTNAAELVLPPVLEQSRRLRSYLPLAGRQGAPGIDLAAYLVDDGCQVVGLLLRRQAPPLIEDEFLLLRASAS